MGRRLTPLVILLSLRTLAAANDCSEQSYQSLMTCSPPDACRPRLMKLHVACIMENEAAFRAVDQAKTQAELDAALARTTELKNKYGRMPWILFREDGNTRTDSVYLNPISGGSVFFKAAQSYQNGYEQRLLAAQKRITHPSEGRAGPPGPHHHGAGRDQHNSFLTDASKKLLEAGRWDEAEGLLDFGMEMSPDGQTYALRAMARVKQGKLPDAKRDADKALALDSQNGLAREILSFVDSTRRGKSIRKLKDDPDFSRFLADAEDDLEGPSGRPGSGFQTPEASQHLLASHGKSYSAPGPYESLLENIGNKIRLGDLERALREADQAVARSKTDARAWVLRARALNLLKRYEDALRDAAAALKLDPDNVQALLERAFALERLGRHAEARETLVKLLRLDPQNASAHLALARVLEILGHAAEALSEYERAAQLDGSQDQLLAEARTRLGYKSAAPDPASGAWKIFLPGVMALLALIWYKGSRRKHRK